HLGDFQLFHQVEGVAEVYAVAGLDGLLANTDGQMRFAYARWPDEYQVFPVVQEGEVEQGIDLTFGDRGLVPVVEALQTLVGREASLFAIAGNSFGFACL